MSETTNRLQIEMKKLRYCCVVILLTTGTSGFAAGHRVLIAHQGSLTVFETDGAVSWQLPWNSSHDVHADSAGFFYAIRGQTEVCKIDSATKEVVWSYDSKKSNGNEGKRVEVHSFQPLKDGAMMIAESGVGRIIEIDRDGKLLKEIKLKLNRPHPHQDTRLARKIDNGNYLVAHEGEGYVREYSGETGQVTWEFEVPLDRGRKPSPGHGFDAYGSKLFSAIRLPNGNTLIGGGNNHTVLEVTPEKQVVWSLKQNELPGIALAWVTTLECLPNGHYVIGNCHAEASNPQLIEIDPATKQVVWKLNRYEITGNNASNSILLDQASSSLR